MMLMYYLLKQRRQLLGVRLGRTCHLLCRSLAYF